MMRLIPLLLLCACAAPTAGRDVHGVPLGTNVQGKPNDKDVQGNRPQDAQGNTPRDWYGNRVGSQTPNAFAVGH